MRIDSQTAESATSTAGSDVVRSQFLDVPAVGRVLPSYVAGLARDVGRLTPLLAAGRWADVRRVAHQLRGSGGSYGFPELTHLAGVVESAIDARQPAATVSAGIESLVALIRRIDGYDPAIESQGEAQAPSRAAA